MRENCILDCDSPSYPPTQEEYIQCGCPMCRKTLEQVGIILDKDGKVTEPRTVGGSLD